MQQLNEFLKTTNYQPFFNIARAAVVLAVCVIVVVLLLHTLHLLGQRSPLYRKNEPVAGWTKRVYAAGALMVAVLFILFWLLGYWSHALWAAFIYL